MRQGRQGGEPGCSYHGQKSCRGLSRTHEAGRRRAKPVLIIRGGPGGT
jgi:hypothetical protein